MYFIHFKFPSSLLLSFVLYLPFPLSYLNQNLVYMPFDRYTNLPVTQVRKRVKKIRYVKTENGNYGGIFVFRF
jgi:hypothetical protein